MITIRPANAADALAVSLLLRQLGYEVSPPGAADRLARLAGTGSDPVYLAVEDGQPLGLLALHWTAMLHREKPEARITVLVVEEQARRRGVGQRLVEHALAAARDAGCGRLELTSANNRADAHAFYRADGFQQSSLRFHRDLED